MLHTATDESRLHVQDVYKDGAAFFPLWEAVSSMALTAPLRSDGATVDLEQGSDVKKGGMLDILTLHPKLLHLSHLQGLWLFLLVFSDLVMLCSTPCTSY